MFRNVKSFYDTRTFQVGIQVVMIVISIVSIVGASLAMYYLNLSSGDTDYILKNWQTKPVDIDHNTLCMIS